jgi:hypothetical protein
MKMTRNILRRLELKIHHAMTLDQIRKEAGTESPTKIDTVKTAIENALLLKPHADI